MVSKARLDLPEPDSPVITIRASRGSSRETSLRLCSRAPEMTILSEAGIDNESTQANRCSPPGELRTPPDLPSFQPFPQPPGPRRGANHRAFALRVGMR